MNRNEIVFRLGVGPRCIQIDGLVKFVFILVIDFLVKSARTVVFQSGTTCVTYGHESKFLFHTRDYPNLSSCGETAQLVMQDF